MRTLLEITVLLWLQLTALAVSASASEEWHVEREMQRREVQQLVARGEILPLQALLAKLPVPTPGRLLEVEFELEEGRYVYEMEFLTPGGSVIEYKVDAASGEVLKSEVED